MAKSEMREFFGDTQEVEFEGKTYTIGRLTCDQFPEIEEHIEELRRAPYAGKSKMAEGLAAKVLAELADKPASWLQALDSARGNFFILYLALKPAYMKVNRGKMIDFNVAKVRKEYKKPLDELKNLCIWLTSTEELFAQLRGKGVEDKKDDPLEDDGPADSETGTS